MIIDNKRLINKTSTISGVVPTIPGSGVTNVYDHTQGGWTTTDIYIGEVFMNTADDKIWFRSENGINLLGYSGMTSDFQDLGDTPSGYAGYAGYAVVVNPGETGEEYELISSVSAFTELSDTPAGYTGYDGYILSVDEATSAITFVENINTFSGLTDIPAFEGSKFLRTNSSNTSTEWIDASTLYVTLDTTQSISGVKTFTSGITMSNGLFLTSPLEFTGTETTTINNISTDTGFTLANDNELATSLAIREYITSQQLESGATNWVTTDTNQTITGIKTLTSPIVDEINITGNINITGYTLYDMSSYVYYGSENLDGSYRTYVDVDGELVTELRTAGVWATYGMSGSTQTLETTLFNGNNTNGYDIVMDSDDYVMSSSFDPDAWTDGSNLAMYDAEFYLSRYNDDATIYSELYGSSVKVSMNITSGSTVVGIDAELSDSLEYLTLKGPLRWREELSDNYVIFDKSAISGTDRTFAFPDKDGTFAMLSDITAASGATDTLSEILAIGNTTEANDIIVSTGGRLIMTDKVSAVQYELFMSGGTFGVQTI